MDTDAWRVLRHGRDSDVVLAHGAPGELQAASSDSRHERPTDTRRGVLVSMRSE